MTELQDKIKERLKKRNRRYAVKPDASVRRSLSFETAVVSIGSEIFGIPAEFVREIAISPEIMKIPGLPEWLPGIVQMRSELLCACKLAWWFKLETSTEHPFMVVVEDKRGAVGLLVDRVLGFREIYSDEIAENLGRTRSDSGRPVKAVTRDLVSVVDVAAILGDDNLIVDHVGAV